MAMKINKLEIENVKRVKAVRLEPAADGLTIIGGNNRQGKTSVLDAIAWALGGDRFRPSQPQREGSVVPPNLHIVMNNGLIVERKGKNSALKVIDPSGNKGGQQLLGIFLFLICDPANSQPLIVLFLFLPFQRFQPVLHTDDL